MVVKARTKRARWPTALEFQNQGDRLLPVALGFGGCRVLDDDRGENAVRPTGGKENGNRPAKVASVSPDTGRLLPAILSPPDPTVNNMA